jgi:hypothetical protein
VAVGQFALVCIGGGMITTGLTLCVTGVGAIFGIPMMAVGWGIIENNTNHIGARHAS